jgi:diphthine synthase
MSTPICPGPALKQLEAKSELMGHVPHNTLYFISIGICDERDISIKALDVAKSCDLLFAEFYTTKLDTIKEKLEKLIGKPIRVLSRQEVEERYQEIILNESKTKKVGFLVGGDCFTATTHTALRLEAIKQGIQTKVIHGSSIISVVGETGLHLQKFGQFVTIPFPEKTKGQLPESVYEVIKENKKRGLHTLCLLDIDGEEGRYLSVNEGLEILFKIEERRKEGVITEDSDVVVFCRAGSDTSKLYYGKVKDLIGKDFGEPPAVFIILGKLHFTEEEYLQQFC